jgi:Arc/MetJ-type ribon-helix-helix transcriptional regulator
MLPRGREAETILKRSKEKSSNIVRITVSIPRSYTELMDMLVDQKFYHSRSEVVQTALRELLMREAGPNGELIVRLRKNAVPVDSKYLSE